MSVVLRSARPYGEEAVDVALDNDVIVAIAAPGTLPLDGRFQETCDVLLRQQVSPTIPVAVIPAAPMHAIHRAPRRPPALNGRPCPFQHRLPGTEQFDQSPAMLHQTIRIPDHPAMDQRGRRGAGPLPCTTLVVPRLGRREMDLARRVHGMGRQPPQHHRGADAVEFLVARNPAERPQEGRAGGDGPERGKVSMKSIEARHTDTDSRLERIRQHGREGPHLVCHPRQAVGQVDEAHDAHVAPRSGLVLAATGPRHRMLRSILGHRHRNGQPATHSTAGPQPETDHMPRHAPPRDGRTAPADTLPRNPSDIPIS